MVRVAANWQPAKGSSMAEKDKANVSKTTSIGIDVGGTKTRLVLLDGNLEVLEDIKIKTPKVKQEFGEELICPGSAGNGVQPYFVR